MLLHILDLDLGDLGPDVRNSSVGDNNVKMVDTEGREVLHGVGRVSGDGGIDLDDVKGGAFSLR